MMLDNDINIGSNNYITIAFNIFIWATVLGVHMPFNFRTVHDEM